MKFLLLGLFLSSCANASDFCRRHRDLPSLQKYLRDEKNLLSFSNNQGLFGLETGVCWWHSRLQRRLSYLANFRPDLEKPDSKEVMSLLGRLKRHDEVITIPGYANVREFSQAHEAEIQRSLNAWMAGDSFKRMKWVNGLRGKTKFKNEDVFKRHLEDIYQVFKNSNGIDVQILQMPGLTAHAWLILDIKRISEDHYDFEVIDSNESDVVATLSIVGTKLSMAPVKTKYNTKSFRHYSAHFYGDFVAYTSFKRELQHLKNAVRTYCSKFRPSSG